MVWGLGCGVDVDGFAFWIGLACKVQNIYGSLILESA